MKKKSTPFWEQIIKKSLDKIEESLEQIKKSTVQARSYTNHAPSSLQNM